MEQNNNSYIIYAALNGFTIPKPCFNAILNNDILANLSSAEAVDMEEENDPILRNANRVIKVYANKYDNEWKYIRSETLRKWQNNDLDEALLLRVDFGGIALQDIWDNEAELYSVFKTCIIETSTNNNLILIETEYE